MDLSVLCTHFSMSTQGTIRLSKETQSRIRGCGKMGDSFEKVIVGLLDENESLAEKVVENEI